MYLLVVGPPTFAYHTRMTPIEGLRVITLCYLVPSFFICDTTKFNSLAKLPKTYTAVTFWIFMSFKQEILKWQRFKSPWDFCIAWYLLWLKSMLWLQFKIFTRETALKLTEFEEHRRKIAVQKFKSKYAHLFLSNLSFIKFMVNFHQQYARPLSIMTKWNLQRHSHYSSDSFAKSAYPIFNFLCWT